MIAIDTRDFCIPSDENDYDELVAFADTIAGIQTHEVIPINVLDKIRAEFINRYPKNYAGELEFDGNDCHFSLNDVMQIIDYVLRIDDKLKADKEGE